MVGRELKTTLYFNQPTFTLLVPDSLPAPKNIMSKKGCAAARRPLWADTGYSPTMKVTSVGRREEGRRKWVRSCILQDRSGRKATAPI